MVSCITFGEISMVYLFSQVWVNVSIVSEQLSYTHDILKYKLKVAFIDDSNGYSNSL